MRLPIRDSIRPLALRRSLAIALFAVFSAACGGSMIDAEFSSVSNDPPPSAVLIAAPRTP